MKLVYISSPYYAQTAEEMEKNKNDALSACEYAYSLSLLAGEKIVPLTPHVNFPYFDVHDPEEKTKMERMGLLLLSKSDEMWVAGDAITDEMRNEIRAAVRMGIPVMSMSMESIKIQDAAKDLRLMLNVGNCVKNSNHQDYTDQILVLKESRLAPWALEAENQLWKADSGFGLDPNARGRAVYATNLFDGEKARWNRDDFLGIADVDRLPDWAMEKVLDNQREDLEDNQL